MHEPEPAGKKEVARLRRFERPTLAFGGQYSIQLSYGRFFEAAYITGLDAKMRRRT